MLSLEHFRTSFSSLHFKYRTRIVKFFCSSYLQLDHLVHLVTLSDFFPDSLFKTFFLFSSCNGVSCKKNIFFVMLKKKKLNFYSKALLNCIQFNSGIWFLR